MPELEWITIKGFKSIAAIEKMEMQAINIIIGANGSGKSNFIGAFSFLHAIKEGHLKDYTIRCGGADKVLHFGSRNTEKISFHLSFSEGDNQYSIDLSPTRDDQLYPSSEYVYFWNKQKYASPYGEGLSGKGGEAGISDPNISNRIAKYVRRHFDRWRVYHFHDTSDLSPMKRTADLNDNGFLRKDGANLPAFLYLLRENFKSSYDLIRGSVQLVAPFFDDFQLQPLRLNEDKIRLEWRHKGSEAYFDASSLSDGTLRFIALATLLLQPKHFLPSVILMDEPELGLHPYAIAVLASMIKQASKQAQTIISTQSSLLIDHFEPENILVANRIDGGTKFQRLASADLETWLDDYSLGQLWEKNEFGGRPSGV
jgi:predicted ATPase